MAVSSAAMGLRNLPAKSWQVNVGWVIAADLAAWTRLLGLYDHDGLRDADSDTLRPGTSPPASPSTPSSGL